MGILLLARLLLVAVFLAAALAKLADGDGTRQAIVAFGIPPFLARPLRFLLPLAELAVAIALCVPRTGWWGAVGALTLLLLFSVIITITLIRGRAPDCHCFGQFYSRPVGKDTLLRNGALAAIAAVLIWAGPAQAESGLLSSLTGVQLAGLGTAVVVFALLGIQGWFILHLLRQNGRLLRRVEAIETRLDGTPSSTQQSLPTRLQGLPAGTAAPPFKLPDSNGHVITLPDLLASRKPLLLLFADPNCGPCATLLPEVAQWQQKHASVLTIALISRGDPKKNQKMAREYGLDYLLIQNDREVSQAYRAEVTPSAVAILSDGTIGSPLAKGARAISALVQEMVTSPRRLDAAPSSFPQEGSGPLWEMAAGYLNTKSAAGS